VAINWDVRLATPSLARPRNGLGVAALVVGVASLVAALSFILFPVGLLGGLAAVVLGGIAAIRGKAKGATNPGQAVAGIICGTSRRPRRRAPGTWTARSGLAAGIGQPAPPARTAWVA
jgi:hypothetical protein